MIRVCPFTLAIKINSAGSFLFQNKKNVLAKVIKIFDGNIKSLEMVDEKHYKIAFQDDIKELSDSELLYMLSSGTTKGVLLYIFVVAALENGLDLLIDEVENHFHKTLVENMISFSKIRLLIKNVQLLYLLHIIVKF